MPRGNQIARQWRLLQLLGRPTGLAVEDGARELQEIRELPGGRLQLTLKVADTLDVRR